MNQRLSRLCTLMQFSDSAFPVGTFSFSNGLETAQFEGVVHDADTLRQFARSIARQAAFSDAVAALHAFRAADSGEYEAIATADRYLMLFKLNDEARLMLQRMGKKLAELARRLFPSEVGNRWLDDINAGAVPGSYPVAQGIAFHAVGLEETDLFASLMFGAVNMVLGAALRCVRVSHYDTQSILLELSEDVPRLYEEVAPLRLDEMCSFVPQVDIFASLHEKGNMRMFMS